MKLSSGLIVLGAEAWQNVCKEYTGYILKHYQTETIEPLIWLFIKWLFLLIKFCLTKEVYCTMSCVFFFQKLLDRYDTNFTEIFWAFRWNWDICDFLAHIQHVKLINWLLTFLLASLICVGQVLFDIRHTKLHTRTCIHAF